MSESQVDERELDEKSLGERELAERELADKLTSFAKAVTGGEPDSTILAMLKGFETSDPPSEDSLRVRIAHSSVMLFVGAKCGLKDLLKRSPDTFAVVGLFAARVPNPDVATLTDSKLCTTEDRRWPTCREAPQ